MSRIDKIDFCEMRIKLELSEKKLHEHHRRDFLMREVNYILNIFSY